MAYYFELDLTKCSACGACAVSCMDQNDIDVEAGERPFRQVFRSEVSDPETGKKRLNFYSVSCMHCPDAPCILACPSNCLYKDPETGFTLYDNTNCIGCHSCAMACPFGAPAYRVDGKMQKCDGCIERIKAGLIPACVRNCPTGALTLNSDDTESEAVLSLKKMGDEILKDYN